MANRRVTRFLRDEGGNVIGGSNFKVRVYSTYASALATLYKDSAGSFSRANPGFANSGWSTTLTGTMAPAATSIAVVSTSGAVAGDMFLVIDGANTVYLVVKTVTDATHLELVAAPGGAVTYSIGSTVNDESMYGHWQAFIADTQDYDLTFENVAAGRESPPDPVYTGIGGGAVLQSLADAKGDIIAATAADTFTRKAVGSNGEFLMADSAQADGLDWSAVVDVQTFTADGTWTKPAGAKWIQVIAIGSGAGGAGGTSGSAGTNREGGNGGGGGARTCRFLDASAAGATESVTVAAGGSGGAGGGVSGGNGGAGAMSSFGTLVVAGGAGANNWTGIGGGGGGTAANGVTTTGGEPRGGAAGAPGNPPSSDEGGAGGGNYNSASGQGGLAIHGGAGGAGTRSSAGQASNAGGSSITGAGGGGAGAIIGTDNAEVAGGAGGATNSYVVGGGGAGGAVNGGAGAAGTSRSGTGRSGDGGGGGGSQDSGTGGAGGAGGVPGGGGGGGGGGTGTGGAGGAGARGEVIVTTWR